MRPLCRGIRTRHRATAAPGGRLGVPVLVAVGTAPDGGLDRRSRLVSRGNQEGAAGCRGGHPAFAEGGDLQRQPLAFRHRPVPRRGGPGCSVHRPLPPHSLFPFYLPSHAPHPGGGDARAGRSDDRAFPVHLSPGFHAALGEPGVDTPGRFHGRCRAVCAGGGEYLPLHVRSLPDHPGLLRRTAGRLAADSHISKKHGPTAPPR